MEDYDEQRKWPQLSWLALVVGAIVWFAIIIYVSGKAACLAQSRCGKEDLILSSILGVGFLAPAGIATLLVGNFGSKAHKTVSVIKCIGVTLWCILLFYPVWGSFLFHDPDFVNMGD